MLRAAGLLVPLVLLTACGPKISDPSKVEGVFNCDAIALRGGDGAVDDCDLQACMACVDFCGLDCSVADSQPPEYSCPGLGAYTVYDFCPDWGGDTDGR